MKRREVIAGLAAVTATWPRCTRAQTRRKTALIGLIGSGSAVTHGRHLEAFRQQLKALGHTEGQNFALQARWAGGRVERFQELVADLVAMKVDVLVVAHSAAAIEAKKATDSIPIVMLSGDPVGLGLAQSLARPGGNATGISNLSVEIIGKRLEFLKEMVPNLARVAVLREANLAIHSRFVQEVESAGRTLKIDTQIVAARGPEDIEATLAAAVSGKAQALIVFEGPLANTNIAQIVALAAKSRLPDMYSFRESADAGGLMAYGSNLVATY